MLLFFSLPQACGPLRTAVFKPLSSYQRSTSFSLHLNQCGTHRMRTSYIHGWQVLCCTDTRENNNECIDSAHFHSPTQSFFMPLRLWHLCGVCRHKRHPVCVLLRQLSFIVPHAYTQPHINTHKKNKIWFLNVPVENLWDTKSNFKRKHKFH